MQHFKKLLIMLLTALFAVPAYLSMAFADVNEESRSKAYLIMALPRAIPISQLDNSALIDLRTKEEYNANHIKGASKLGYDDALKAIESGKLDNKALLFVYTTSPKNSYSQALEDSENMQTYMNDERQGPIRRLISFVLSLFGISPGSTDTGTGIEETPDYGTIGGTEDEIVGGITGEEIEGSIPPVVDETEENENEMEEPTPPEEENMLGENNNSLLPPLEEITLPGEDNTSIEDNTSDTEDTMDDTEDSEEQQDVAFNPLLPNNGQNEETMPGNGIDDTSNTGISDTEETIIPYEQVDPNPAYNAQQTMSLEKLTKALSQRGYNFTIIPFN